MTSEDTSDKTNLLFESATSSSDCDEIWSSCRENVDSEGRFSSYDDRVDNNDCDCGNKRGNILSSEKRKQRPQLTDESIDIDDIETIADESDDNLSSQEVKFKLSWRRWLLLMTFTIIGFLNGMVSVEDSRMSVACYLC